MANKLKGLLFVDTFKLNLYRSIAAGLVWGIIFWFTHPAQGIPTFAIIAVPLWFPLVMPLVSLMFIMLYFIGLLIDSMVELPIKFGVITSWLLLFFTVPGDPILYFLFKKKSEWQIVDNFKMLNFAGYFLVYKENSYTQNAVHTSTSSSSENTDCPFTGNVIGSKNTTVLGFNYPVSDKIFEIRNDWKVYSKGNIIGWIDREGYIHKDHTTDGEKVNLNATMSGQKIARIQSGACYVDNEKIGNLM